MGTTIDPLKILVATKVVTHAEYLAICKFEDENFSPPSLRNYGRRRTNNKRGKRKARIGYIPKYYMKKSVKDWDFKMTNRMLTETAINIEKKLLRPLIVNNIIPEFPLSLSLENYSPLNLDDAFPLPELKQSDLDIYLNHPHTPQHSKVAHQETRHTSPAKHKPAINIIFQTF